MVIPKRKSNYFTKWSLLPACLVGCWRYLNILDSAEHHSTPEQSAKTLQYCAISCCLCTFIVKFAVLIVMYDVCKKDDTLHDHPFQLGCPNVLSLVGDPLSGNGSGSPNHKQF
jgi:hypothetical protein